MQLSATSRAGMSGMSMLMLSVSGSCGGIGEYLIRGRGGVGVGWGGRDPPLTIWAAHRCLSSSEPCASSVLIAPFERQG